VWAGVDVGGRRKGLHAAVVDEHALVDGPARLAGADNVVRWLARHAPALVAVDSPRSAAPPGSRSREDERLLARDVCGIRYTPERRLLRANPYYEWILVGLELYAALARAGMPTIECFPTAAWTRWGGRRGARSRTAWSAETLDGLGLAGVPARMGQDGRDAIGAALTARAHVRGNAECFGEIVVPL
jgi:predicted nuclease with RNAse H fold